MRSIRALDREHRRASTGRHHGRVAPFWRVAAVGLLSTAAVAGCAPTVAPPSAAVPATTAPAVADAAGTTLAATGSRGCGATSSVQRGEQTERSIETEGGTRRYELFVPARDDGAPMPLVIDLHGYLSGADGQIAISDLASTAESAGFILATPQGNGPLPFWNAVPHPDLPDDVQFIRALIDDVAGELCVDSDRVYVDGFSNGAFLTSLIACQLADRVAAVAAVAGLMLPAGCAPARPVPILAIHGTADQFVTFDGGPNVALGSLAWDDASTRAFADLPFAPVTATVDRWADLYACRKPAREVPVSASVARVTFEDCEQEADIDLYILDGAGHTWPGSEFARASAAVLGPATDEIDANDVIWDFFRAHPMRRGAEVAPSGTAPSEPIR